MSKYTHPDLTLGKKSKMKVDLVNTDYLTMFFYYKNLIFDYQRMKKGHKRSRLEKEADRIKTWLAVNRSINYQK